MGGRFELVLAATAEGVEVPHQVLRRLSILGRLADRRSARAAENVRERLKTCPGAYHPLANQAVVAAVA
jgi:hypothetical protein